jgi:hypothetical protein
MSRTFHYGGQAVYEGVMIRGQRCLTMAIRSSSGEIIVHSQPLPGVYMGRLRNTRFIRGIIILAETVVLGTQALMRSANMALGDKESIPSGMVWGSVFFGLALGIGLFFIVPLLVARYAIFPYMSPLAGNIIEGLLRIAIFVIYLKVTRLLPDLRRIYSYHGAEHKVINAFEDGSTLDVAGVKPYPTSHLRCGTSFLLIVLVIAILGYSLTGRPALWVSILSRLALLPVIVGVAYELVRYSADHSRSPFVRALLAPGRALQSLTTGEPTDDQVEVALRAISTALVLDRREAQPLIMETAPGSATPS